MLTISHAFISSFAFGFVNSCITLEFRIQAICKFCVKFDGCGEDGMLDVQEKTGEEQKLLPGPGEYPEESEAFRKSEQDPKVEEVEERQERT